MPKSICEICRSALNDDGSCPLCETENTAERIFRHYEKSVLRRMTAEEFEELNYGWIDDEEIEYGLQNSFFSEEDFAADDELIERLKWDDGGYRECICPICRATPHEDPIFRILFEPHSWY